MKNFSLFGMGSTYSTEVIVLVWVKRTANHPAGYTLGVFDNFIKTVARIIKRNQVKLVIGCDHPWHRLNILENILEKNFSSCHTGDCLLFLGDGSDILTMILETVLSSDSSRYRYSTKVNPLIKLNGPKIQDDVPGIYLLRMPELKGRTSIYKPGESTEVEVCIGGTRYQGAQVEMFLPCNSPKAVEDKYLPLFNENFTLVRGREYFTGDRDHMIKIIRDVVFTN